MFSLKNLSLQRARSLTHKALKENSFAKRELRVASSDLAHGVDLEASRRVCSWSHFPRGKGSLFTGLPRDFTGPCEVSWNSLGSSMFHCRYLGDGRCADNT